MRWLIVVAVLAAVAVAGVMGYQRFAAPTVTLTEVVEGPVVQAFYATGTLQPLREFPIKSNVEGVVTEMPVDKGDAIHKGDKIAFVRVDEYQMRFSQAHADFEMARQMALEETSPALQELDSKIKAAGEQLKLAQSELARLTDARTNNAASQTDTDHAQDRVQVLWSLAESLRGQRGSKKLELDRNLAVAKAALDIAQWNLDQQVIASPTDGAVLDRPASLGTRVKINDHLMQVADVSPSNLVMRAAVDEEDKTRVCADQRVIVTLYSYPGRVFEGRVRKIYPQADPDRRTFEVDVEMKPSDPSFAAGMTGELAFVAASKDSALVIPSQSVQAGNVWTVRDGRLQQVTDVVLGLRSIERTEVISGLQRGDRVVISAATGIGSGTRVRTKFIDPVEAANVNKPVAAPENGFKGFN